jgi:hypothetical protein
MRSGIAATMVTLLVTSGCWGYNKSAKRGAYVLDTVMIVGGGGIVAADIFLSEDQTCMMPPEPGCNEPVSPISGAMVAGGLLVMGGLIGIIINATRDEVKISR